FRHMTKLIENGHLYIAQPPLYRLKATQFEQWAYSDKDKEEILENLKGNKKLYIQRYKGLGEMTAEQLWETTMNPATRILLAVNIGDNIKADDTFRTLMGAEVLPRKTFIQTYAKAVKNLDI
ncbi:MAG: DNA topoisomerase IV subunit B, partial [Dehalococcoidales bacterium]|nr:DNA topoisomerase IV subunit B [Dehalococcoidales bacterium]